MHSHLSCRSRSSPSTGPFSVSQDTHQRTVHLVVIDPTFVAGVVGRVYVDALDAARIAREERLQRIQVVSVDNQVVINAARV